ncbi:MAG: PTS sugar transporter subunit IIB [Syntrophales bacterium]|nr:PTS sugar transporter subunit IIB [Syntrophales bacterium]
MDVALVRVDNRLVHGQIIEAWIPFLGAKAIVVVNDEVAGDFFRETVIRMAVPQGIEVIISGVEELGRLVRGNGGALSLKTVVLFASLPDALKAYRSGFSFRKLNLGNIYTDDCIRELSSCVLLGEDDLECIDTLLKEGVEIEIRRVPREKPYNIIDIYRP